MLVAQLLQPGYVDLLSAFLDSVRASHYPPELIARLLHQMEIDLPPATQGEACRLVHGLAYNSDSCRCCRWDRLLERWRDTPVPANSADEAIWRRRLHAHKSPHPQMSERQGEQHRRPGQTL